MAHPFASIPLGFAVMGRGDVVVGRVRVGLVRGPPPRRPRARGARVDAVPRAAARRTRGSSAVRHPARRQVAHFLAPTTRIWDDVVHTCAHQRLFCDEVCVDAWLAATKHEKGYVMDLPTLWRLARGRYAGRLDRGYSARPRRPRPRTSWRSASAVRSGRPSHVSSTPSRVTMYEPGITRSRHGTTSRMPNAGAVGESQPGMMLGS